MLADELHIGGRFKRRALCPSERLEAARGLLRQDLRSKRKPLICGKLETDRRGGNKFWPIYNTVSMLGPDCDKRQDRELLRGLPLIRAQLIIRWIHLRYRVLLDIDVFQQTF